MKRLTLLLAFSVPVLSVRASLDEILAPLPPPRPVLEVAEKLDQKSANSGEESIFPRQERLAVEDPITVSDLQESLEKGLAERLGSVGDITLVALRDLPDLSRKSKPFSIEFLSLPGRLSRSNMLLRFRISNVSGLLGEWAIPFQARVYQDVWVAMTPLRKGEIASASDLEIRTVDQLEMPDAIPVDRDILGRHEYSRDLTPGKILGWRDLEERSLIDKGEMVEVVGNKGLLAITMRAVARQDGAVGDLIVLRNLDSNKEFSGRVVAENKVEVTF